MTIAADNRLDEARNERDHLEGWLYDEGLRAANSVVDHVAQHVKASPAAIKACKEAMQDALNDLTHEMRVEIENRIVAFENEVNTP